MRLRPLRLLHQLAQNHQLEDHVAVQELMDLNFAPADNHTVTKPYTIPKSLLASWRQQRRSTSRQFKDVMVIKLRSGDGGPGKVSFLRESGRSVGPPDGGDGGAGGNVFVQASPQVSSLAHLRHIYRAQNGKTGGSTQLTGKRGDNVVLQVPVGTKLWWSPDPVILRELMANSANANQVETPVDAVANWSRFENDTSIQLHRETFSDGIGGWVFREQEEEKWRSNVHFKRVMQRVRQFDLINRRQERSQDLFPFTGLDLREPTDPVLLLNGGTGGLGNMHFQSPELRSPTFAKQGRAGVEVSLILELKMLADLGLVGLPNAGKSTLLKAISRAQPAVGDYEFTTLVPQVGTISLGISNRQFSVADIPGIIKDAHRDKGLGLGFLRHIERCHGFAFVVALDRADPVQDLEILLCELGSRVTGKRGLVIATKADTSRAETNYPKLAAFALEKQWPIVPCSALGGDVPGVVEQMAIAAGVRG